MPPKKSTNIFRLPGLGVLRYAITYFIILSTASTLFKAGTTDVSNASEAAEALRLLAGNATRILFAQGIVGVGFLAVLVRTTGAAYDLRQAVGGSTAFMQNLL